MRSGSASADRASRPISSASDDAPARRRGTESARNRRTMIVMVRLKPHTMRVAEFDITSCTALAGPRHIPCARPPGMRRFHGGSYPHPARNARFAAPGLSVGTRTLVVRLDRRSSIGSKSDTSHRPDSCRGEPSNRSSGVRSKCEQEWPPAAGISVDEWRTLARSSTTSGTSRSSSTPFLETRGMADDRPVDGQSECASLRSRAEARPW